MNISSNRSQKGICLSLKGEITIREAAKLKEILLKHLAKEKDLKINLEGTTQIDTSGLQLLYAAHQSAVQQGQTLLLEKPSPEFTEAARLAGLFFHTREGHLEGCLWKGR